MRWAFLALLLVACSQSASEKAKADLDFLKSQHASPDEICRAERKLANAYRDEHNAKEWKLTDAEADIACVNVEMDRQES